MTPLDSDRRADHVLLVSDGDDWLARVRGALHGSALEVWAARTAAEAIERVRGNPRLLVVADTCAADCSGVALCRRLREDEACAEVPVLLVSRWSSEMDRVLAFENGADDFLADPFFPRELLSRVQALRRRHFRTSPTEIRDKASFGEVRVDLRNAVVEVEQRRVPLTTREFELLRLLVENRGRVVRREQLIDELLGSPDAASPRVIDTHVKSIRQKLGPARTCIETVRGVGYRLDPDAATA